MKDYNKLLASDFKFLKNVQVNIDLSSTKWENIYGQTHKEYEKDPKCKHLKYQNIALEINGIFTLNRSIKIFH